MPAHGYLNVSGADFECLRGYRQVDQDCVEIRMPENAYLDDSSYGLGWRCDRGYSQQAETCVARRLPNNANLDHSGNGWECSPPFEQRGQRCRLQQPL